MIRRITLAASLAFAAPCVHATTYTLEPDYTQGVFRWDHLGFSSPAAQFSQATGTLDYDSANPSKASVTVTIPLANITTGVPALDDHFRSDDFFDTAKYATATFRSTKVDAGRDRMHLEVTGNLSLHGATKPVLLEVTIVKVGTNPRTQLATIGFSATTTLKRSDFGLGKYAPQVSDEVQMHIVTQAVDARAYAEYLRAEAAEEAKAAAKK
jgi:polyisoprenoid-binding protein YceI